MIVGVYLEPFWVAIRLRIASHVSIFAVATMANPSTRDAALAAAYPPFVVDTARAVCADTIVKIVASDTRMVSVVGYSIHYRLGPHKHVYWSYYFSADLQHRKPYLSKSISTTLPFEISMIIEKKSVSVPAAYQMICQDASRHLATVKSIQNMGAGGVKLEVNNIYQNNL